MRRAMRALCPALSVAALSFAGACARRPIAADTGLNKDFALADQMQRQNAPALVAAPELAPVPDSAPVRPAQMRRPMVVTRVVTRTITVVRPPARSDAGTAYNVEGAVPASHDVRTSGGAMGGDVVASGAERRGARRDAEATGSYGVDVPASDAGTYAGATSAGANAGTVVSPTSAPDGEYGSNVPVSRQPQAHAARDGVFGSLAGAILGAAASGRGNRVRGGLIGAVAGGALGAIYGGAVDRTTSGYGYGSAYRSPRAYRTY